MMFILNLCKPFFKRNYSCFCFILADTKTCGSHLQSLNFKIKNEKLPQIEL